MHVILLSYEYPPYVWGGIGTFVKDVAQGLYRQGVKVTVISGYPVPHTHVQKFDVNQEKKEGGINVLRFPYPNMPPRFTMFQILNLKRIYKIVKRMDADVIHGQSGYTFPALLNLKNLAPLVVTFHSSPKMELMWNLCSLTRGGSFRDFYTYVMGYPVWASVYKKEFVSSDVAVAVSGALMKELMSEMGTKHRGKFLYIHNGVDVETLEKEYSNVYPYDKEESDPIIFFAGRLFWRKGVLNLVELARFLQKKYHLDLKIVIQGWGPLYKRIRKRMLEYGLTNIVLKGFTTRTEFMKSMRRAVFVVIPSFYEACPMLLLESMCLGKIPIMFNVPYALELTKNGKCGIIARNIHDMAKKISLLYTEHDTDYLERRIRNFARSEYNVVNTASKYFDLYKTLVD